MSELHPRIAVIGGAGYVGLITGVGFASLGYNTTCVDINEQRVNQLTNASSPIHEPGLEPLLRQLLDNRQINFTTDAANALANSNIVVIAVGSPSLPNGRADISQAINAIETVATNASPNSTIIVKSTLPIGVYPRIEEILATKAPTLSVVFNPEFLREGHGLYDFYHPERVVVGSNSPTALATIRKLYQPLLDASYKLPQELNITPKQDYPIHRNRRHHRPDDQVRLQRLPRHPRLIHQRTRLDLRKRQRRCQNRNYRTRTRLPHRLLLYPTWPWFRRTLSRKGP